MSIKKKLSLVFLFLLIGIFFVSFVNAWNNNTFYNGTNQNSLENISFYGEQNITRYLQVPQNTVLINAYLNISGYKSLFNAQNTTLLLINESGLTTSPYGIEITAKQNVTLKSIEVGNLCSGYTNVTLEDIMFAQYYSNFTFGTSKNVTLNYRLIGGNSYYIRVHNNSNSYTSCYAYNSGTDMTNKYYSNHIFFVGDDGGNPSYVRNVQAVYTELNNSNITNPSIKVSTSQVWNQLGLFNILNNRTTNIASYINTYLGSCSFVGNLCDVPFTFYSRTAGIIQYLDLLFDNIGLIENSQSKNTSSYETANEGFVINVTYDSSYYSSINANLIYNGTMYNGTKVGTGNNVLFTKNLDIPFVSTAVNKSFYWQIAITNATGTDFFNSTLNNQTVNPIFFGICNATNNMPYINFTFKDEATASNINGTIDSSTWVYYLGYGTQNKTLIYSNTTQNSAYAYCLTPKDKSLKTTLSLKYALTGYPQRTYNPALLTLTNSTTNTILYLLGSSDGIYSSIQTIESSGSPITGVVVTAERLINNVYTLIETGTTDSSGLVTFWVNPNYEHRIIATKSGYNTQTVYIRPSQSTYSIIMSSGGATGNVSYTSNLEGIKWYVYPNSGRVSGSVTFGMNLTASLGNLDSCKMELIRADTKAILIDTTTTSGIPYGCNINITYTIPTDMRVFGRFYVDLTSTSGYFPIESDALWYLMETDVSYWTNIKSFFTDLKNTPEFGATSLRNEFTRIIVFYFMLMLIMGIFTYLTEFDRVYPGFFIIIVAIIIFFASQGNFFTMDYGSSAIPSKLNQYGFALIAGFVALGTVFINWGRNM